MLSIFSNVHSINDTTKIHLGWNKNQLSLSAFYDNGYVIPTNVFVRGTNINSALIDDYQSITFKLTSRTAGESFWERLCNYPEWGIGVKIIDFYDRNEIGMPIAIFGTLEAPFLRVSKFSFNYELGFGLTFNWKAFNPITNQYNVAIGAGQAFMSTAGLNLTYETEYHLDVIAGVNFSHYSNGAIKLPNFGINAFGPKVGVKYNFFDRPKYVKKPIPAFKSRNEWTISTFFAIKNLIFDSVNIDILEKYEGVFFPVFGVSGLYNRQISHFSKIGVGMTFNFNESINAQIQIQNNELEDIDGPFLDKLQLSIYPSYELCIDKISIQLQPAFYIYRKEYKNQSPVFHQRINLKYQITDNIFAGITLRDYSFHADFVEWTLGYKFNKK